MRYEFTENRQTASVYAWVNIAVSNPGGPGSGKLAVLAVKLRAASGLKDLVLLYCYNKA
jgi:hypothetical protein